STRICHLAVPPDPLESEWSLVFPTENGSIFSYIGNDLRPANPGAICIHVMGDLLLNSLSFSELSLT
ncbi:MAG: hypothetical protein L0Z46_01685, partial [Nitrospiraceae bacterium]|nr:hypothetical protein [Nitrospiraceae bacterium]